MKRRRKESGYALLLVFLMAAAIAIALYKELPRVAFEAQRQKEQLLIERGEQYRRAIQVFWATNKRYPAKIEDLENFNNRRFLRKRFVDPMTGKDEWRLIHINNGVLTDSKLSKKKPGDKDANESTAGQYIGLMPGLGQTGTGTGQSSAVNMATRRRPSDNATPGVGGMGDQQQPGMPGQTAGPGMPPGLPGMPGVQGMPGQIPGGPPMLGQTGVPGAVPNPASQASSSYIGTSSYMGGSSTSSPAVPTNAYVAAPGIGLMPGQPVNSQMGGVSPGQFTGGMPGQLGGGMPNQRTDLSVDPGYTQQPGNFPQPGANFPTTGQNPGLDAIRNALMSPRPGGAPTTGMTTGGGGQMMGGGLAGVASNVDSDSIMVHNDRTNYSEWEFVFDYSNYRQPPDPNSGSVGTPVTQMGPGGTPNAQGQTNSQGQANAPVPTQFGTAPVPNNTGATPFGPTGTQPPPGVPGIPPRQ